MQARYNNKTNTFTIYVQYDHFLRSYYTDDVTFTPTAAKRNSYFYLASKEKGKAIIDWGDGTVLERDFVKTSSAYYGYVCMFKSLNSDSYKGEGSRWIFNKEDGSELVPYDNHVYADGDKNKIREIKITCTNDVTMFNSTLNRMISFPLLRCETLKNIHIEYAKEIQEIPIDRISGLKELTSLELTALGATMQIIPDTLFNLKKLKSLTLSGIFNLENPKSSNLRRIGELTELTSLDLSQSNVTVYPEEFLKLKELKTLNLSSQVNKAPKYSDEITEINPSLTSYTTLVEVKARTDFDDLTGIGNIENLATYSCWSSWNLDVGNLPTYLREMRGLKTVNFGQALKTAPRVNTFVQSFYDLVKNWSLLTENETASDGKTNQFYGLNVIIYSSVYKEDKRPNDEMIKLIDELTKNYNQTWTIRPPEGKEVKKTIPEGYYLDDSEIHSPNGIIQNNEIKPYPEEYYSNLNQD